ncbi:hypothetical protein AVEN_266758-1 [Araneus ventricosus]|uniref:Integrase p58-like C-terminal domain-containing protein n=1 Tax=Araneus ventricosus TaxID=182803 RepID=A0A4Y2U430_ARAVE|nr:hypothetical protein AVEN_266758-1 [Araneus ventricosus]
MYNAKRRRGLSPKLQQNWEGPYTVVKKLNDVVYRVQRSPTAKPKVIHLNRLAPYKATDHSSICGGGGGDISDPELTFHKKLQTKEEKFHGPQVRGGVGQVGGMFGALDVTVTITLSRHTLQPRENFVARTISEGLFDEQACDHRVSFHTWVRTLGVEIHFILLTFLGGVCLDSSLFLKDSAIRFQVIWYGRSKMKIECSIH